MSRGRRIARWGWLAPAAPLALSGCGGGGHPQLKVSAAASLRTAFGEYAHSFTAATVHYSFAGSDTLAAQIEQGARPDVFASANLALPARLYSGGLVERPVEFAANRLVLAVPRGSPIRSLAGAERPGVTLAVGTPTVPIGAYTATVIARIPTVQRRRLLANVRDRESDVTGIVGKLTEGSVGAGVVYVTDVEATHGSLRAIALPASLQPRVGYAIAVVRGAPQPVAARAFVAGVVGPSGRSVLAAHGFLPPATR